MKSALIYTHVFIWLAKDDPILPVSLRDRVCGKKFVGGVRSLGSQESGESVGEVPITE